MIRLKIDNLTKSYDQTVALNRLSLSVIADEILAIVGPSGCGKTTLLKMISGLEQPDSGVVTIGQQVVYNGATGAFTAPENRNMALVFQNYAVWPHKTVFQNIAYPLQVKKYSKGDVQKRVSEIVELVKLEGKEDRYPHALSGGEKQRVALARALVMSPDVLLLDEPFSNLDAKLRTEMQYEIKRIRKELGLTIIHVTHDQSEAMGLSDRIAVMNKGKIIQVDRPRQIYRAPKTTFVANFIGAANDISALYSADNAADSAHIVRPQDVVLSNCDSATYRGQILSRTYRGSYTEYIVAVNGLRVQAESAADKAFDEADAVGVDFKNVLCIAHNCF
ncbi:MAG: polyamine ABC transporter ATP-binding protein [Acidobacteria bacterium]|nr:MAG: polyamine ABC transporter ATP-binding protein [Acidobacteriota bacterium]